MHTGYNDLKLVVANWQHLNIYKRIAQELALKKRLTTKRKEAMVSALWPLAHWIAKRHLQEAIKVVEWIYELKPDFRPPEKGFWGWMYRGMGFATTEKLRIIGRKIKYGIWS